MHECKEHLIVCDTIARALSSEIGATISAMRDSGAATGKGGHVLNPFPHIQGLEDRSAQFLVAAKRFIQLLAEVFNDVFQTDFHGPHFHKIRDWVAREHGANSPIYELVAQIEPRLKAIVNLRNFQEHPDGGTRTVIDNFRRLPHSKVRPPVWYVTGQPPTPIAEDMVDTVAFLLQAAEHLFILCILHVGDIGFPYRIVDIPEKDRCKECPLRYRLQVFFAPG
jgi:hypothetical protein